MLEKVGAKQASIKKKKEIQKQQRRNQMNQSRKKKRDLILNEKRKLGFDKSPPVLVTILNNSEENLENLFDLLYKSDPDLILEKTPSGLINLMVPRFKVRYQILPSSDDLITNLDAVKVADVLLIVHPSEVEEDYSLSDNQFLTCIYSHCLPTTMHIVYDLENASSKKRQKSKKIVQKAIEEKFPDEKLHQVTNSSEILQLLQLIVNCKKRRVSFRMHRPIIMAESYSYESATNCLKVKGYVRGNPLDVNSLIHIPGWHDYQIESIRKLNDPRPIGKSGRKMDVEDEETTLKADPMKQESLESENIPDPMEGEQTWPTPEELASAASEAKKRVVKVPKGTSDYQAAWIVDDKSDEEAKDSDLSDEEDGKNIEDPIADNLGASSEEYESENDEDFETLTITEAGEDATVYDEKMDIQEERNQLVKFREAREEELFPDEIDTPQDIPARLRFARYRGLKSFIHSPWDPKENLPSDYSRIFQFENFTHTRKKVIKSLKDNENSVSPGNYVEISLSQVPLQVWENLSKSPKNLLILVGLLPHEHKMSVLNVVVRKSADFEEPIKSKEELIFHLGFRRFKTRPIFSQHTNGEKFKFERFLPNEGAVVASFYGPITYPPASAIIFKAGKDGSQKLVGTGSLLSVNPDRMVIKRIRLSGHPFKIHKRGAVVRYMFFNREDIKWFKPIELRTKYGRHGHIREPLGTHGHMKCIFDRQLVANDTVILNLYKRVYPKWHFDPIPYNHFGAPKMDEGEN